MSSGSLPPVPALIPIKSLKGAISSSNSCATQSPKSKKVMGEQRPRRPHSQPPADLINSGARSRGCSSAAPAQTWKVRSDRHRKSDRRRRHRRGIRSRSSSPETPVTPRVNPIFVWVRQEDTRIVEVKCEDYDKRNRILLTKTPHGWRATPRTETLQPSRDLVGKKHHHHHRNKKRKHKLKHKSTSVQVDSDAETGDYEDEDGFHSPTKDSDYPSWTFPVNIESHLPSHTIHIPRKRSLSLEQSSSESASVNSGVCETTQMETNKSVAKICDVSPLDNLLAVAELEFNQQLQSGEWDKTPSIPENNTLETQIANDIICKNFEINEEQKDFLDDMEHLKSLIESCSKNDDKIIIEDDDFNSQVKVEDCDYNDDDDNTIAMDDILSRLEQSLRSPEEADHIVDNIEPFNSQSKCINNDIVENNFCTIPEVLEELESNLQSNQETKINDLKEPTLSPPESQDKSNVEEPTDLSIKQVPIEEENNKNSEQPTDLSICKILSTPDLTLSSTRFSPRPSSQNSEALQSPQPSGIPAVPPSPDSLISPTINSLKKSQFLESLLTAPVPKMSLNSEVTIERYNQPLDLGPNHRKSASPTITCSEEANEEPVTKKQKTSDDSLKNMLHVDVGLKEQKLEEVKSSPNLLQLLRTEDISSTPLHQLKKLLSDKNLNVPDPMLVPKELLSKIICSPGVEIPLLLKTRPELRLPEALAFPHLLQDPDILVITLQQLETIIRKQGPQEAPKTSATPTEQTKQSAKKVTDKPSPKNKEETKNNVDKKTELAGEIEAATNAAFNQMMWLPYMNQLDAALSFGGNPDLMKMLNGSIPTMYPTQMTDLSHLLSANRFPPGGPLGFPPLSQANASMNLNFGAPNPLEMSLWQEAMLQANMLRSKNMFDGTFKPNYPNFEKANNGNGNKNSFAKTHHLKQQHQALGTQGANPFLSSQQFQNPFFNVPQGYQPKNNLQMPQFNPHLHQKQDKHINYGGTGRAQKTQQIANKNNNKSNEESIKQKVFCKPFANIIGHHHQQQHQQQQQQQKNVSHHHHHHQSKETHFKPIDLSGSQMMSTSSSSSTGNRIKVRQQSHLIDPLYQQQYNSASSKLLKPDGIPEVGSTTATIEEMQEAQKHLWHPLFGNQKGYTNPWNWNSSMTASVE